MGPQVQNRTPLENPEKEVDTWESVGVERNGDAERRVEAGSRGGFGV